MRISVISVGRDRSGPTLELVQAYAGRCPWPIRLIDVGPRTGPDPVRNRADEASRIQKSLSAGSVLIALDEHGQSLDSRAFASCLAHFQEDGRSDVAFVLGGADGLDPALVKRAERVLALGPMTWPHRLARVMLMEQLYRASTILAGHPYHRD